MFESVGIKIIAMFVQSATNTFSYASTARPHGTPSERVGHEELVEFMHAPLPAMSSYVNVVLEGDPVFRPYTTQLAASATYRLPEGPVAMALRVGQAVPVGNTGMVPVDHAVVLSMVELSKREMMYAEVPDVEVA